MSHSGDAKFELDGLRPGQVNESAPERQDRTRLSVNCNLDLFSSFCLTVVHDCYPVFYIPTFRVLKPLYAHPLRLSYTCMR